MLHHENKAEESTVLPRVLQPKPFELELADEEPHNIPKIAQATVRSCSLPKRLYMMIDGTGKG